MKFIILGAGAIGCYVGGRLAVSGQQVSLVGRPRVVTALSAQGLRLSDQTGFDAQVKAADLHLATSIAEAFSKHSSHSFSGSLYQVIPDPA